MKFTTQMILEKQTDAKLSFLLSASLKDINDDKKGIDFEKTIKAYEDEFITGLTEEEKEKISKAVEKYKETNKIETENDIEALAKYIAGLLKQYGFKGDCEEYAKNFVNSSKSAEEKQETVVTEIVRMYNDLKAQNYRI